MITNTEMEKRCEFCMALSPVVYCKADAAHLCLSCDAKVHSANALSYRHPRTLMCESCRYEPALVRCLDHQMFMCQSCDTSHHVSFQHEKRVISCYVGCPSAKDLAALWGFDCNELDNNFTGGSSSRGTKVVRNDNEQERSYLILQQILDLERLELCKGIDDSCLLHVKERSGGLPYRQNTMWKAHKTIDDQIEHSGGNLDFQHSDSSLEEKTEETLSSPFSQFDQLTNTGNPLHGDSFWPCKSPAHNNEIWLQSMQDLGVCDDVQCLDDVNIPDVDLTFRNFEELFGSEHEPNRPLVDDKSMTCSFEDKHSSVGKSDRGCPNTIEEISGPSNDVNKENDTYNQVHQFQTITYLPPQIRPSYSTSSYYVSRITGESSISECKDDGLSPTFPSHLEITRLDDKENVIMRYKEKKVLRHEKQAQYASPKSKYDEKNGGKGQVLKVEGRECN